MKGIVKGLIAGGIIVIIGIVVLLITLGVNNWSISGAKFTMTTYTSTQDNTGLRVEIGAGALITEFYDGEEIIVEYPVADNYKSSVSEDDGTLKFYSKPKAFFWWGNKNIPDTVIKLPRSKAFNLYVDMSAGNVTLAAGSYSNVTIDMSAGKVVSEYIDCAFFDCDMSAGKLIIGETVCEKFECDMSAGAVTVSKLTATQTDIDISAGSVNLSLTGEKSEYSITTDVSAGHCNVGEQTGSTGKRISVDISAGSVDFTFNA